MHQVGSRLSRAALASSLAVAVGVTVGALFTTSASPPKALLPPPAVDPTASLLLPPVEGAPGRCQLAVVTRSTGPAPAKARLDLHLVGVDRSHASWTASPDGAAHRFTDLGGGTYHLSVLAAGYEAVALPAFRCDGDGARGFVSVALRPERGRAAGSVTGRDGMRPANVELLIERLTGPQGSSGVLHVPVDVEGRFDVALAPGRYRLLALAPHHGSVQQEISVGEVGRTEVRFSLPWRPEASGIVVDAAGKPVPGAHVFAGPLVDPRVPPNGVVTDDEGRFVLPLVAGAPVVLTAHAPGGLATVSLPSVRALEGHAGIRLALAAGRTVEGWVQRRDGRAHAFGEVRYRVRALGLVGQIRADGEGHFTVPGMPRAHDVELWAAGSAVGAWGAQVATPERSRVLLTFVPPAY